MELTAQILDLRAELGAHPKLLIKRDDAISFGFGGNKVRKLEYVLAQARANGADTLVTLGGLQSNHARATAAAGVPAAGALMTPPPSSRRRCR